MRKQTNRMFSILLTLVMLLTLLPVSAQATTTYTKAGEIGAVTASSVTVHIPRKWLCSRYSPFSKATNSHICRFGES